VQCHLAGRAVGDDVGDGFDPEDGGGETADACAEPPCLDWDASGEGKGDADERHYANVIATTGSPRPRQTRQGGAV